MNEKGALALPCIVCGKQLRDAMGGKDTLEPPERNQPYNGTAFMTSGHYGSTVFDEPFGQTIEINVCDVCLLDAAKEHKVMYYRRYERREYSDRGWWVPDVDEERVRQIDKQRHG